MKSMLIILSFLILQSSVMAVDIKLGKPTRDGRPVLKIVGAIQVQQFPKVLMSDKTIIDFSSQGGNPHALTALVTWFKSQLRGAKPTFIVRRQCASTCIGFLATLNNMAGKGHLKLIIDSKTHIGFHGCWNLDKQIYEHKCTVEMIRYLSSQGMESRWLNDHQDNFHRPTKEYIVNYKAEDAGLRDSGLMNHASIEPLTANLLK